MGIIIKQSIKGTIWSYLGVGIGFVTTAYLYPKFLTPEIVGLFGLLVSIATLFANFSAFGMNAVANRLFPYFRNDSNGHNGFLLTAIIPQLIGFFLSIILFLIFKNQIIANNIEKSPLFAHYIFLIIPVSFCYLTFSFFDIYNKLLYNSVTGIFLEQVLQRFFIFIVVVLYILNIISLNILVLGYALAISARAFLILLLLVKNKKLNLHANFQFITKKLKKEIIDVAAFSIITGLGSMIVFQIDKIIINQILDLSNVGVYTIAFFFGTLVVIPSRPLLKISGTLIADAWKDNDTKTITTIYYKSCLNQFIIGGFLFVGIWANINNILMILGPEYIQSKWVIFFIGLGYLIDMTTGTNGQIINFSKYYRVSLLFILLLIGIVVTLLYILIPIWGIVGAAIAIATALFLNNTMRYIFLYKKYRMQPFNYKFIVIAVFYIVLYFILSFIPQQQLILDIFIRGIIITLATVLFTYIIPISEDINLIFNKIRLFLKGINK